MPAGGTQRAGKSENHETTFDCSTHDCGTGSETTIAAVISDSQTHSKTVVIDGKQVPDVAVLDAAITAGLPPHITAATAMDALTHAVEAYVSGYATTQTKRMSRAAVYMIYKNIVKVYENPDDLKARRNFWLHPSMPGWHLPLPM